jgi:hypothetical protein
MLYGLARWRFDQHLHLRRHGLREDVKAPLPRRSEDTLRTLKLVDRKEIPPARAGL